jgi:nitrate/TMAO reductase-like tetraheme cytochrome c subunit
MGSCILTKNGNHNCCSGCHPIHKHDLEAQSAKPKIGKIRYEATNMDHKPK